MADRAIILVTGATGSQGGGVVRHLLRSRSWRVRAMTRNPGSPKAAALANAGAEIVRGNFDDLASLHSATQGCYGVFGVTNFWESFDGEYQHGVNLVDAVKAAGVKHFVYSGLPHVKKLTGGELIVPHFDRKAEVEAYARNLIPDCSFVHVAFYYENFLTFFPPKQQGDGSYGFGFPLGQTSMGGIAVEDVGGIVAAMFAQPERFPRRTVRVVADNLPGAQYAAIMSHALGKRIVYNHIPREVFASFGFPGADDLANMFEYYRRYPERESDLAECRALYPGMQAFENWVTAHKTDFRLESATSSGAAQ